MRMATKARPSPPAMRAKGPINLDQPFSVSTGAFTITAAGAVAGTIAPGISGTGAAATTVRAGVVGSRAATWVGCGAALLGAEVEVGLG